MIITSLDLSAKLYAEMNLTAPICRRFFIRLSTKSVGQYKFTSSNQTRNWNMLLQTYSRQKVTARKSVFVRKGIV